MGKKFRVIVADSRPLFEGKALVRELVKEGLSCTYILINALSYAMHDVSTIFLGAHAMLSNGLLYSRIGSGMVLTAAKSRNIPVLVLCESIKFTDRVQLDSVTFNELGSTQELVNISINPQQNEIESEGLKNWKQESNLSVLNLLYDLSPSGTIKKVITELGSLPPSAVPVVNSLTR
jgi:translation initiation factor eIF-2B subunit delta